MVPDIASVRYAVLMSGGVDRLHADDIVAGIDMVGLAGDAGGEVGEQIEPGAADLIEGDVAPQRRVVLVPLQDVAEVADAATRRAS